MDGNDLLLREIRWLREQGRPWLTGERDAAGPLRPADWQRAALERQRHFARRAARRFPDPQRWLWTERSLAQASDWWTAAWKAMLVPSGVRVIDACCGAGADLVAMAAAHHPVLGVDLDPVMAELAQANAEGMGVEAQVRCAAIESVPIPAGTWLHIDPDRRPESLSTDVADAFSPNWQTVWNLVRQAEGAIVKVGPRTEFSPNAANCIERDSLRIWVGNDGECRQQLLLFGAAAESAASRSGASSSGQRICVLAEPAPENRHQVRSQVTVIPATDPAPPTDRVGRYLFDLHRCLHAAESAASWAAEHGLVPITDPGGYYTSDACVRTPWAQAFEVLEIVPWDDRRVRRTLRRHAAGIVEIKARLLRLDASRWQKRLSRPEGEPLTVLVTRMGGRVRAIFARRVSDET